VSVSSRSKNPIRLKKDEVDYLVREYAHINFGSSALMSFLEVVFRTIKSKISFPLESSLLDIGCGRGYFLQYLNNQGYKELLGMDPCKELIHESVFDNVQYGGFEDNEFPDGSVDVVFSCHTLHHLVDPYPVYALKEMLRIARKYVIIVEINNANIPMFLLSWFTRRVERNAFRYNLTKVKRLAMQGSEEIVFASNLISSYVSGDNWFYRTLSRIGAPPYNIMILKKKK
jgi:SAM-dependent methyltransferase